MLLLWIVFKCCCKLWARENVLEQNSHLKSLWPWWMMWMCFFKFPSWENDLPQDSHLWSLWPSWTMWICFFKLPAWENDLSQDSHLWSLWPSWTVWICFFKYCAPENDFPSHPWWLFKKTAIWRCEIVKESDMVLYLKVSRGYKVLSMILDLHVHFP